jgi:hypothetical protein
MPVELRRQVSCRPIDGGGMASSTIDQFRIAIAKQELVHHVADRCAFVPEA